MNNKQIFSLLIIFLLGLLAGGCGGMDMTNPQVVCKKVAITRDWVEGLSRDYYQVDTIGYYYQSNGFCITPKEGL